MSDEGEKPLPKGPALGWPRVIAMIGVLLLADQVSKIIMLDLIFDPPRIIEVTGFFRFAPVWNPGVSFGLLASDNPFAPFLLSGFAFAVVAVMVYWLIKGANRLASTGLAWIIAGAVGNAVDRLLYGAVVDFLDFHWAGTHFPTFNIADAAITLGVGLLLLDSFRYNGERDTKNSNLGQDE